MIVSQRRDFSPWKPPRPLEALPEAELSAAAAHVTGSAKGKSKRSKCGPPPMPSSSSSIAEHPIERERKRKTTEIVVLISMQELSSGCAASFTASASPFLISDTARAWQAELVSRGRHKIYGIEY